MMDKEKAMKTSWHIFLAAMAVLTVLFFFDIKFVVAGVNILVLDVLAAGIWIFVRLCRWAGRENTGRRTVAVIAITLAGSLAASVQLFGLMMNGRWYGYIEGTEPQTRRTFVVEYQCDLLQKGSAKVYERVGPFLFACDEEEYVGEFTFESPEDRRIYVSEDGKYIVVVYFFLEPIFTIPL